MLEDLKRRSVGLRQASGLGEDALRDRFVVGELVTPGVGKDQE